MLPANSVIPVQTTLDWTRLGAVPESFGTAWGSVDVLALERRQVAHGLVRCKHQREERRVGRHHEVAREPPFEREVGDAKRAILIDLMAVAGIVCRLGHAPRDAALPTVRDLPRDRSPIGLVE